MSARILVYIVVLLTAGLSSAIADQSSILDDILQQSTSLEEECVAALSDKVSLNARHVSIAMRKGWWACTKAILEASAAAGVDTRNEFDLESRNIFREINTLKAVLESARPVQRWALS